MAYVRNSNWLSKAGGEEGIKLKWELGWVVKDLACGNETARR